MADLGESVYERPHGGGDDVSLCAGQEGEGERGRVYRVVEEDETVDVVLVGEGQLYVFAGYALEEIEGVAQEKMLWDARLGLLGECVHGTSKRGGTCSGAVVAQDVGL